MAGAAAIARKPRASRGRAAARGAGGHRRRSSTRSARPSATSGCRWRLFEDLLSAFRQDVGVRRYATWDDVLDYCRRSANPVGRLVLRIAGYDDARLDAWSDAVCTALQLTNFWQDVKPDFERGRVYLPQQQAAAYAADEADLSRPETSRPWRLALAAAVARTRALYEAGRPLCDALSGRLRLELRATWLGGMRILNRIERPGLRRPGTPARPRRRSMSAGWPGASPPGCRDERATPASTTRSWCCRSRKRRAIVAVWDFCRAVDDAVDEVAPESQRGSLLSTEARALAAKSLAGWRAELNEVYDGTPTTPQGQALQPFVHEFNLPRLQFEALIDGVEMDLSYHRYPNFETLLQVLPPGRVLGRPDLRRDLRLPRSGRAGLRRQPRRGAAADEHHPRRGRGPEEGPRLPAAGRPAAGSR